MVPTDTLKLIAFFEQCQATDKAAGILKKSPRTRSSQKRRNRLIFLPCIAVNQATGSIVVTNIMTTIKATDAIATIADPTIVLKKIDASIILNTTTRTQRAASPTKRRMIAGVITSRKRATRPCIMTSPLYQVQAICPEEGVVLAQDLLCALVLGLTLA